MHNKTIEECEKALRLHINFNGVSSGGRYLEIMDALARQYRGSPAFKVSSFLNDYFKAVGVASLDEALERLRNIDIEGEK